MGTAMEMATGVVTPTAAAMLMAVMVATAAVTVAMAATAGMAKVRKSL